MAEEIHNGKSPTPHATINLVEAIQKHDEGMMRELSACFPASVLSYDRQTHTAEVQPLVKQGTYNEEWKYSTRDPLRVTVWAIQNGGFSQDVPLFVGDTGWVIASDRDTSLLKQTGALSSVVLEKARLDIAVSVSYPQNPNTMALHDLTHGVFIPDNWGKFEFERFKDGKPIAADDEEVKLDESLYIGQAMDIKVEADSEEEDEEDDDEGEEGDGTEEEPEEEEEAEEEPEDTQTEERYEKETTSSLVIENHGAAHMLASSPTEEKTRARLTVINDKLKCAVRDEENAVTIAFEISTEDGIYISRIGKEEDFFYTYKEGKGKIEILNGDKKVVIAFEDGGIKVETEGSVNVRAIGHSRINTAEDIAVTAKNALMNVDSANIVCGGDGLLLAGKDVHIQSLSKVNLTAGRSIAITAGKNFNLFSPEGISFYGRKAVKFESAKAVRMLTESRISMSSRNIAIGGKMMVKDGNMTINAGVSMTLDAQSIDILGDEVVNISGSVSVQGWSKGSCGGTSAWVW